MTETEKERTDRQLVELLNELRVALPGAQILLAFLLTAPFATRFGRATALDRAVLFATTIVTAAGVILLLAPSLYHRLRWAEGGKQDVIYMGHRLFLLGTSCLGIGMVCTVFLIANLLYGARAAAPATVLMFLLVLVTWYVIPIRRSRDPRIRRLE